MLASREFLAKCEQCKARGLFLKWQPPLRVARGYADLGYEEFLLLLDRTLVSLVNGSKSTFPDMHEHLFFVVPSIQDIVDELDQRGIDISAVHYENQRAWVVCVAHSTRGEEFSSRHVELECAFADVLLQVTRGAES